MLHEVDVSSFVMMQVKEFLSRFANIPDLIELDHLTVSGDVTFGRGVSLKVRYKSNIKNVWRCISSRQGLKVNVIHLPEVSLFAKLHSRNSLVMCFTGNQYHHSIGCKKRSMSYKETRNMNLKF